MADGCARPCEGHDASEAATWHPEIAPRPCKELNFTRRLERVPTMVLPFLVCLVLPSFAGVLACAPQLTDVEAAWLLGFKAAKPEATGEEVSGTGEFCGCASGVSLCLSGVWRGFRLCALR